MLNVSIVLYKSTQNEIKHIVNLCSKVEKINQILLIDNGHSSFAKDLEVVYSKVKYFKMTSNLGYGRGHNIGLNITLKSDVDFHLVLNSDVDFNPIDISEYINYIKNFPNVILSSPTIKNPSERSISYFKLTPSPLSMLGRFLLPKYYKNNLAIINKDNYEIFHCPYLSGAFLLFNMSNMNKIGFFDERFFMYPEDIDISLRAALLGQCVGVSKYKVFHSHKAESKKKLFLLIIHIKNMVIYFNKWGWKSSKERHRVNLVAGKKYDN